MTYEFDDDEALQPASIDTDGTDLRGTVFIIPLDAPLPNELADVVMPKGTLYERLISIAKDPEGEFAFCPITGAEMMALDRAWRMLQGAKKVMILTELPGARYDIIFTQAMRQVGLRSVDWPVVSEAIARRVRTVQRTEDATPWVMAAPGTTAKKRMSGSNITAIDKTIPPPPDGEDEDPS